MYRKKQEEKHALVAGWLAAFILFAAMPAICFAQQQVIRQTTPVQVDKRQLEQQQIQQQTTEQQQQVIKPLPQRVPARVDPSRIQRIQTPPPNLPPGQPMEPTKGTFEYPTEPEPNTGLTEPRPSHPRPGCFIATAAYGTPMAKEIVVLEYFRDTYLLTNPVGRRLVTLYYKHSPPLAAYIARHETLRAITRAALWPLVFCINNMVLVTVLLLAGVSTGFGLYAGRLMKKNGPQP